MTHCSWSPVEAAVFEDPAAELVAGAAILAGFGEFAIAGEFTDLGVAHAGQVGDDDPACGPQWNASARSEAVSSRGRHGRPRPGQGDMTVFRPPCS